MILLQENADLSSRNTFGLPGIARWLATVDTADDLVGLVNDPRFRGLRRIMLGGGSNIVLRGGTVDALLIRFSPGGWREIARQVSRVRIEVDAGMVWHDLVAACVENGLGGIENLALIPGTAGAAPVQNIGAYGVELQSVLHSVDTVHLLTGERRTLSRDECALSYRDSIFKHEARDLAITALRLDLATDSPLSLGYRDLQDELRLLGVEPADATRRLVFDMVCAIRRRKLPDPAVTGNAGSFFRNPVVTRARFDALRARYPGIVGYPQDSGEVKVAAGWLIDQAGWKGVVSDGVAVHERQALVLVNRGGATGEAVLAMSARISADIRARFGIELEPEPVLI